MEIITINTEYIKLDQFLKWANVAMSGTDAKDLIFDGEIKVNGVVETRRGRKLYNGDVVLFDRTSFKVESPFQGK